MVPKLMFSRDGSKIEIRVCVSIRVSVGIRVRCGPWGEDKV
jgi:hypothetical protein